MVKKIVFILILLVASGVSACSQQPLDSCNKYIEPSLDISFCAPSKWTIIKSAGEPYQKVVGEKKDGLVPTISISANDYDMTLKEFTDKGIEPVTKNYSEKGYSSVEIESQSEFTAKMTKGYRIAYNAKIQGRGLRLIQYTFAGKGNTKILITAYSLPSDKDILDKIFDDAMKTFEVSQ